MPFSLTLLGQRHSHSLSLSLQGKKFQFYSLKFILEGFEVGGTDRYSYRYSVGEMRGPLGAVIGRYPSSDGSAPNDGIIKHNRKCRDVAFLVIFIAFWISMIVNSSFGFNQGNPMRLTYGLDYKGNVCGDKHAHPGLHQLELRYWLNPNQVYESGLKNGQFELANARSICLLDCPTPSDDTLNWVCDYPEGDIRLSMDDWIDRNYDYFEFLTPEMRNSSLQLQGPCYPVIFPSVNGKVY